MVADIQSVEAARLSFPSKVEKIALTSQHPRLDTELDWPCHDPTVPIGPPRESSKARKFPSAFARITCGSGRPDTMRLRELRRTGWASLFGVRAVAAPPLIRAGSYRRSGRTGRGVLSRTT